MTSKTYNITSSCDFPDRPWPVEVFSGYVLPVLLTVVVLGLVAYVGLLIANEFKRRSTLSDAEELLRKHKTDTK